ncbi:DedA family protein [Novibacillus thermophilus]|jgi:membrane protein DedA with SNARE-associated domain|uniref:VTT domain-containing protein n=1 Tax=Novibacillus thermophilus TaxID=1471761 RepID=A0A1U9K8Z1_9BACL|nr:VTT domain-containing protein [Novibacillus thermophilus]AQS56525.1 hypothetical protein B0W44_12890 [Novibacillus thermophilus]
MIQSLLNALEGWGIPGLLIVMAIEGSSFPFPGVFLVVTYGYVLTPTFPKLVGLAFGMSFVYSVASYIPYGIGYQLESIIPQRFKRKLYKAQDAFRKYGLWSVALTRPFGVGNYISYVAGMCKVSAWQYGCLTLVGVFPWACAMLWMGSVFRGNVYAVGQIFYDYQWYLYGLAAMALLVVVFGRYVWQNRWKSTPLSKREGSDK